MKILLIVLLIIGILGYLATLPKNVQYDANAERNEIISEVITEANLSKEFERYVAIGDSYTIGEGVNQNYPQMLTSHLNEVGIDVSLIENPSKTGWTTNHAIIFEIPRLKKADPTFVTVLIGVNDWVQGVPADKFRQQFKKLINLILEEVSNERVIVITIPDFSKTPKGHLYSEGRDISEGIKEFNQIIIEESKKLKVVDIFKLSQAMENNPDLVAKDGLHPSVEEYRLWEQKIFPVAYEILNQP